MSSWVRIQDLSVRLHLSATILNSRETETVLMIRLSFLRIISPLPPLTRERLERPGGQAPSLSFSGDAPMLQLPHIFLDLYVISELQRLPSYRARLCRWNGYF